MKLFKKTMVDKLMYIPYIKQPIVPSLPGLKICEKEVNKNTYLTQKKTDNYCDTLLQVSTGKEELYSCSLLCSSLGEAIIHTPLPLLLQCDLPPLYMVQVVLISDNSDVIDWSFLCRTRFYFFFRWWLIWDLKE